jgi:hypothetical protein
MSNGRQIGTIVGSLVAAYFTAGTSYAAFAVAAGGAVGGYIGGRLDPQNVQGPRIDDLKVTNSNYGVGITELDGAERIGGNVIWSTDKMEVAVEEDVGGKGGGGDTQTSYQYRVHMRVGLVRRPADGSTVSIVKIFRDSKLIWDMTSGQSIGSALATAESPMSTAVMYQGDAAQLPDPYEESILGVGNVPAYRELVSISMRDIDCPGGRVPQFSFVVSTNATVVEENLVYSEAPAAGDGLNAWAVIRADMTWHYNYTGSDLSGTFQLNVYNVGQGYATMTRAMAGGAAHYGLIPVPVSGDGYASAVRMRTTTAASPTVEHVIEQWNLEAGTRTTILAYTPGTADNVIAPASAGYDSHSETFAVRGGGTSRESVITFIRGGVQVISDAISGTPGPVTIRNGVGYALSASGGSLLLSTFDSSSGALVGTSAGPAWVDGGGSIAWAGLMPWDSGVYVWIRNAGDYNLYQVDVYANTWELLSSNVDTTGAEKMGGSGFPTTFYATPQLAIIGPSSEQSGIHRYNVVRFNTVSPETVKVKDVIAARFDSIGETRYDVSAIPDADVIYGYKRASPTSVRAAIEPLLTAFRIFAVDEDGILKFKKYEDITSVASVSFDELGQSENGDEDIFPLARMQEIDLPRSVSVNYIEPNKDFQTASERAARDTTESIEDLTIEIPLAISSSVAKAAAETILYARWNAQNTRVAKLSRKYAFVSPGDGLTIEYPRGTTSLWRVTKANDDGARCEFAVEPGDAALFAKTAVGTTGYEGQQIAALPAPLQAKILDIPILRDADNNAGPYVALDSYAPVAADGELFVGADDATLVSRGTISSSAPIGVAETVLSDWSSVTVDETNLFTVNLGDDVFSNCTRDVLLSNGGEFWAYGQPGRWEIGASALGDNLGDGRYILSRHLRGMFGTEQHRGTHEAGDVFVLLRIAGMLRPDTGVGAIGQSLSYRAVSRGRSFNSSPSQTYANTGEGLKPLSPLNPRRETSTSNDVTVSVDRRSRLAMNNATGSIPLGETAESFTWSFFTSGFAALAGTLVSNASSVTITSAQQTAFGLTPGATIYLRVAQNSDSVGLGHQLEATL